MKTDRIDRIPLYTLFCFSGMLFLFLSLPSKSYTGRTQNTAFFPPYNCENPQLVISTDSRNIAVNQLFTVYATYINLGEPYTTLEFEPTGLVEFDPPLNMPCEFQNDQGTDRCTKFSLRALSPGEVTIHARTDGESCFYSDEGYIGFAWTVREDSIQVVLDDKVWKLYLPTLFN